MPEFGFSGRTILYSIRISSRRTIAIKIEPTGEVVVFAPRFTFPGTIRRFVEKQAKWISETRQRILEHARRHPRPEYRQGDKFLFLGREVTLQVHATGIRRYRPGTFLRDGLSVKVPHSTPEAVKRVVRLTYETATLRLVSRFVHRQAKRLGVRPASIKTSGARGRWGSCSRGSLRFNWRLAMAPRGVIEYLAVHELCHIKVHGHSRHFWVAVEGLMPGYRDARKWLRDNGPRLMAY